VQSKFGWQPRKVLPDPGSIGAEAVPEPDRAMAVAVAETVSGNMIVAIVV
jgi:hypothetical protein